MATFTSQVNGNDIYAKRAEATRSGVNLEKFTDGGTTKLGILPEGITNPTGASDIANTLATQKYVLDQIGGVAGAMVFKDIVNGDKPLPDKGYKAGWVYEVAEAGTYAGQVCENGDMIVCVKDYASGTASNADWAVIQRNLDGIVIGPNSAVDAHIAVFDGATGKLIKDGGEVISNLKTKQTAVTDPTASGTTLTVIDTISQNENGVITATKKTIQDGTTSQKGVVQLAGAIGATVAEENNKAASEKAVRDAINDLDVAAVTVGASKTLDSISEVDGKIAASAVDIQIDESQVTDLVDDLASKQDNLSFEGTYDASTNKVATESTVSDAIKALDVSAISVGADKTLASISEADGKISATPVDIQIAESQVTNLTGDLGAKADKVTSATDGNFAGLDANGNLTDSGSKAADFATAAQGAKADTAVQDASYVHTDNNYTTAEKTKLGGVEAGAQVNVIEKVKINGTEQTVTDKAVDIPVASTSVYGVVTCTTIELA
jgi:hypothetical protein